VSFLSLLSYLSFTRREPRRSTSDDPFTKIRAVYPLSRRSLADIVKQNSRSPVMFDTFEMHRPRFARSSLSLSSRRPARSYVILFNMASRVARATGFIHCTLPDNSEM